MTKLITKSIKVYQRFLSSSLFVTGQCRFYPTCSQYSVEAFERYGIIKGSFLSLRRIIKCTPFSKGGYDPLT